MNLASLALRNVLRNKKRTTVTLLAVIIGVSTTIALAALARGFSNQLVEDSIYNLVGHIKLTNSVEEDKTIYFSETPVGGVKAFIPRLKVNAVINSERESFPVVLVGTSADRERNFSLAGRVKDFENNKVYLGKALVEKLKTRPGKRIVIMAQDEANNLIDRGYIVGEPYEAEVEATEKTFVFTDINSLREMLGLNENRYHEVSVIVEDQNILEAVKDKLVKEYPEALVQSWKEIEPIVVSMVKLQNGFLFIWFFIVVVSVAFGLVNSLLMSIYERVRELKTMNALGMSRKEIVSETLLQSAIILSVGAVIGTILGYQITDNFSDGLDLSAYARGASVVGMGSVVYPQILLTDVLAIVLFLLVLGTMGCLYPALHATRFRR